MFSIIWLNSSVICKHPHELIKKHSRFISTGENNGKEDSANRYIFRLVELKWGCNIEWRGGCLFWKFEWLWRFWVRVEGVLIEKRGWLDARDASGEHCFGRDTGTWFGSFDCLEQKFRITLATSSSEHHIALLHWNVRWITLSKTESLVCTDGSKEVVELLYNPRRVSNQFIATFELDLFVWVWVFISPTLFFNVFLAWSMLW